MALAELNGPLKGIRVLEICHMLAGPYCGMLLADLGAEVIKIETGDGDISRSVGPDYVGPHNVYFSSLNRNKKSVRLDLTNEADRESFQKLVASSHVLITNLRPRAIKKLGLTYEDLRSSNDKLVCLALTGFGLTGSMSEFPAYDYIIQALAGVMMLTGEPDGPPVRAGYSVVDNTGGMMGTIGVLSKLVQGEGGQIDVALYDMLLSQLNYLAAARLNGGAEPKRQSGGGHAHMVPAQLFEAKDGHVAMFISHDGFWRDFATAVGRDDWCTDPDFATMESRRQNREMVINAVQQLFLTRSVEEWLTLLQPLGLVIAGVRTMGQALDDPMIDERDMLVSVPTGHGEMVLIGNPIKMSDADTVFRPAPLLGEHTQSVLSEVS